MNGSCLDLFKKKEEKELKIKNLKDANKSFQSLLIEKEEERIL